MVLPHPEQAILNGLSSLVTGILVSHDGQFTVGTSICNWDVGWVSDFCLLGLINPVTIHIIEATPEAPNTKIGGYENKYMSPIIGTKINSRLRNLLCLFLVIDSALNNPNKTTIVVIIVNGIGANNKLSFGWTIIVKSSSKLVDDDSIVITSPQG